MPPKRKTGIPGEKEDDFEHLLADTFEEEEFPLTPPTQEEMTSSQIGEQKGDEERKEFIEGTKEYWLRSKQLEIEEALRTKNLAKADKIRQEIDELRRRQEDPEFGLFGNQLAEHRNRVRAGRLQQAQEERQLEVKRQDEIQEMKENRRNRPLANDWTIRCTQGRQIPPLYIVQASM